MGFRRRAAETKPYVREREPLLHYRNAEQLDLRDGADVVAEVGEEHRRIEVALVIGDEDVSLIAVETFKPRNVYARARRPHVTPAPELRRRENAGEIEYSPRMTMANSL
jgi:hypothetical protein